MGISKAVGACAAVLFSAVFALRRTASTYVLLPPLHTSLVFTLVAVSSHPVFNFTQLFCKDPDGSFPWWSRLLFCPYLYSTRGYVLMRRIMTGEAVYSRVSEGLYVGGWPVLQENIPPGEPAVLDCTCELPRSTCARHLPYLCIPTWDSRGPRSEDIEVAVKWAAQKRSENRPVFIHCAFGHGRSVAIMCALLVYLGLVETWKDGEKMIKEFRPCIRINRLQKESLDKWSTRFFPRAKGISGKE
eukprot:c26439_g1_i1 orf=608-1339(-)